MRNIVVVPYDPHWPTAYAHEAEFWKHLLGPELVAIHHVGSTSVPGLAAKPVIDMMPLVREIGHMDTFNPTLASYGYEAWGENGIAGRRYFTKGGALHRTHNVHIYEPSNPEVQKHLAFRDYLRAFPAEAENYAALKQEVALANPQDIYGYMNGKEAFIKDMLQKAQDWHAQLSKDPQ